MKAYLHILQQPLLERRQQGSLWLVWFLWGVLLILIAAQVFVRDPDAHRALLLPCILVAGVVVASSWSAFLNSARRQNPPAGARLVPSLRQRLMTLTALLWGAATLVLAAMIWLGFGHFGYALVGIGGILMLLAYTPTARCLVFVPALAWLASALGLDQPFDAAADAIVALGEAATTALGVLALLGCGAYVLGALFPQGSSRHWAMHQQDGQQARARREGGLAGQEAPFGARLAGWWSKGYMALLHRDSAGTGQATAGMAGRMLVYALGPKAHWSGALLTSLLMTLAALAIGRYSATQMKSPMILGPILGPVCILIWLLPVATYVTAVRMAMHRHRMEQSLLRLTPAAPLAADLNQVLGRAVLRQFALVWGTSLASMLVVDLVFRRSGYPSATTLAAALVGLLTGTALLRDYAREAQPLQQNAYAALMAALMVLATPVIHSDWLAQPLHAILVSVIVGGYGLLRMQRRWRGMRAAPPAFPAGRLAA